MHACPEGHEVALHSHIPAALQSGVAPLHAAQLAPQCAAVLATQLPLHSICPFAQLVHVPALQFWVAEHIAHALPQWLLSIAWQVPEQSTSPEGQAH